MFEIRVKEIKPKPKSNIRLQTEGTIESMGQGGTQKIKTCNSQVGNFNVNAGNKYVTRESEKK